MVANTVEFNPSNKSAFVAYEDVIANEEVTLLDDDIENEAVVGVNVILVAADAVVANEELIALVAQLLVPITVPVNDPLNEPVLICVELDISVGLFPTFT